MHTSEHDSPFKRNNAKNAAYLPYRNVNKVDPWEEFRRIKFQSQLNLLQSASNVVPNDHNHSNLHKVLSFVSDLILYFWCDWDGVV